MTVLHTVHSVAPEAGGPSRSVPGLVAALVGAGVDARLHVAERNEPLTLEGVDLVHDHGLWLPVNHRVAQVASEAGVPRVVSPRGMLEPWALAHRRWKKRLAWWLYQRSDLADVAAVLATSAQEADGIRAAGVRAPVAVVPNGVEVPGRLPDRSRSETRRALFLSRVHPKKGLPMLVEAWARVRPAGWELIIAGPDEGGHRAEVEALAEAGKIGDAVRFHGTVTDEKKWGLYRSADLFVLPTHSENFGIVVAEALVAELPVLTTTGAPWELLRRRGCGWWVEPRVESIEGALRDATASTREVLDAMGRRGRQAALEAFAWPAIGHRVAELYRWVLEGSPRPAFVEP